MNGLGSYPLNSVWNYSGFDVYNGIAQSADVDSTEQTVFNNWFFGETAQPPQNDTSGAMFLLF
jgi:hypothetical protein